MHLYFLLLKIVNKKTEPPISLRQLGHPASAGPDAFRPVFTNSLAFSVFFTPDYHIKW
jgi:hypothetical protein